MIHAFKQLRLTNADLLFTGGYLQASGKQLSYRNETGLTTGNQTINGTKTFSGAIYAGDIFDRSDPNRNVISLTQGKIYDEYNTDVFSIDWANRRLYTDDGGGLSDVSLDWQSRRLSGTWVTQNLTTANINATAVSVSNYLDTVNRALYTGGGVISLDWQNKILSGSWDVKGTLTINGGTVLASSDTGNFVDKQSAQTITGQKTFTTTIKVDTISSNNAATYTVNLGTAKLVDSGVNDSVNWQTRNLFNSTGFATLNWQTKSLTGTWNAEDLQVNGNSVVTSNQTGAYTNTFPTHTQTGNLLVGKNQTGILVGKNETGIYTNTFPTHTQTGNILVGQNQTGAYTNTFPTHTQTGNILVGKNQTGSFVSTNDSRALNFSNTVTAGDLSVTNVLSTSSRVLQTGGVTTLDWSNRILSGTWNAGGLTVNGNSVVTSNQTGSFVTQSQTGNFVSRNHWQNFTTSVSTGSDLQWISFPSGNFPSNPKINVTVEVTGDIMYSASIRGITVSGYYLMLSDTVQENGVVAHTFATII